MYAVILAGGGGTRLWPLSRPDLPKPFLRLLGDRSLLRATFDRIVPALVGPGDMFVVTDRRYTALVLDELPELNRSQVLGEPAGRNTAPAIAYAAAAIERPPAEAMLVLPADHLVVARFVEKPSVDAAAALLAGPAPVVWNAGIFAWRRDAIRSALAAHAPELGAAVAAGVDALDRDPAALEAAYATLHPISIDYAVMEPASLAGQVAMVRADVGWSDLGSWAALRDALVASARAAGAPADTVGFGARRDLGSRSTLVMGGTRLVVTIGLQDTIVVDTPDALLVCAADRSQDVRAIAEELARAREEDT